MSSKRLVLFLTLLIAPYGLTACNWGDHVEAAREIQPPSVTKDEQEFMTKVMQANIAELYMARIALQKSANSDVRDYAHMIQSDYHGALEDLADLMKNKNVPAPKTLATEAQQDITRMNRLRSPEFDREFINVMVGDHQRTIEMFRDVQASVHNRDVQKYVEDTLPNLEMHLDKGRQLQSRLFNGRGGPAAQVSF